MNNRVARLINKCNEKKADIKQNKRIYNSLSHTEKFDAKQYMQEFLDAKDAGVTA